MASLPWLSVSEVDEGRAAQPFGYPRTYTRVFRVVTSDRHYAGIAATVCPGIPLWYAPYVTQNGMEYDLDALVVSKTAKRKSDEDDWCVWEVTVNYSTDLGSAGPPDQPGGPGDVVGGSPLSQGAANNPELEPPDIEWDHMEIQVCPTKDLTFPNRKAFVNGAGQPFTPSPTFPVAVPVLMMTRNELDYNYEKARRFAYAVNDAPFLSAAKGEAQCLPAKAKKQFRGRLAYWRVSYKIRFAVPEMAAGEATWQPRILNAGTMEFDDTAGELVPIFGLGGFPVSQPVLLKGKKRAVKDPVTGLIEAEYLKFTLYRETSFSYLINRGLGGRT